MFSDKMEERNHTDKRLVDLVSARVRKVTWAHSCIIKEQDT